MFRKVWEILLGYLLGPLFIVARAEAAKQSADAVSEVLKRAQQAEDDGMPDLARQLRDYAATLGVDSKPEQLLALPSDNGNGAPAGQLPAPRRVGRPRKDEQHTTEQE